MSEFHSEVPGIKSGHAQITPACRAGRGTMEAFDEAVRRLRQTYEAYADGEANAQADWHLVLTVDRPE